MTEAKRTAGQYDGCDIHDATDWLIRYGATIREALELLDKEQTHDAVEDILEKTFLDGAKKGNDLAVKKMLEIQKRDTTEKDRVMDEMAEALKIGLRIRNDAHPNDYYPLVLALQKYEKLEGTNT